MVHKIIASADGIEIWPDSREANKRSSTETDVKTRLLIGEREDKTKVSELMRQELQEEWDHRVARSRMPQDDPAVISDPRRPDFFWDGDDLVARSVIVESVTWDGERFVPVLKGARG